jgi:hypothetical protein
MLCSAGDGNALGVPDSAADLIPAARDPVEAAGRVFDVLAHTRAAALLTDGGLGHRRGEEVVVALQRLPPSSMSHATRDPAIATWKTPPPVLLVSAAAVFLPLTVTVFPVRTFQTSTLFGPGFAASFELAS